MSWLISFARAYKSCAERESIENNEIKKSCPEWDSNPESSAYEATALTITLRGMLSIKRVKIYRFVPVLYLEMHMYHVVDVV